MEEIENPELSTQRTRELYKAKGYPDDCFNPTITNIDLMLQLNKDPEAATLPDQREHLTKVLNQAVLRNLQRFPNNFMF